MKVLQLTVHYPPNVGGVETHLSDLVIGLVNKDIKVIVLAYRPLVVKTNWKIIEKSRNLLIIRLPWIPGFFYKFVHSPMVEFIYLTPFLFIATPIILLLKNPDVIHSHGLIAGFVGAFWGKVFHKKTVISTHSLYHFPTSGIYYNFAKWIFDNNDKTICLSDMSVEEIKRLGVQENKVGRFTYWIDLNIFKPMDKQTIKKELGWDKKFVTFFVGRLIEEKGIPELLNAVNLLPDKYRVVIAGAGPLEEEITKIARKQKGKLQFLGKIDNSDLPKYYNGADLVIVPSTHDEGFGRVILEALACGTPVIGSNRGAIPEAMDKTVGSLIDISPEKIIKSVVYYSKHNSELKRLAVNARKFAKNNYSGKNIEEMIKYYL